MLAACTGLKYYFFFFFFFFLGGGGGGGGGGIYFNFNEVLPEKR